MLLGSTYYYDGNPFLGSPLPPTTTVNSGVLQVGLISGSIVLDMILHNLHSVVTVAVVVTISRVNPISQLLKPCSHRIFGFK